MHVAQTSILQLLRPITHTMFADVFAHIAMQCQLSIVGAFFLQYSRQQFLVMQVVQVICYMGSDGSTAVDQRYVGSSSSRSIITQVIVSQLQQLQSWYSGIEGIVKQWLGCKLAINAPIVNITTAPNTITQLPLQVDEFLFYIQLLICLGIVMTQRACDSLTTHLLSKHTTCGLATPIPSQTQKHTADEHRALILQATLPNCCPQTHDPTYGPIPVNLEAKQDKLPSHLAGSLQ